MKKNVAITLLLLLLIASVGYTYHIGGFNRFFAPKPEVKEEEVVQEVMPPAFTQEEIDSHTEYARQTLIELEKKFGGPQDAHHATQFVWSDEEQKRMMVSGMAMKLMSVSLEDEEMIKKFFEDAGYTNVMSNMADGPSGGLVGYQSKDLVCQIETHFQALGGSELRDVTVRCGSLLTVKENEVMDFLGLVRMTTGVEFAPTEIADFPWRESAEGQGTYVMGYSMRSAELSSEETPDFQSMFTGWGWKMNVFNVSDGTTVGAEGYEKDNMVCRLQNSARLTEGTLGEEGAKFAMTYTLMCGEKAAEASSMMPAGDQKVEETEVINSDETDGTKDDTAAVKRQG